MTETASSRFRAIVFDLDGTLIDSAADLHAALNRLLDRHGRRPLELREATLMIGDGARNLVQRAFAATGGLPNGDDPLTPLTRSFLDIYEAAATDLTVAYPGVEDTLELLAANGHAMGVCTNKPYRATMGILVELGLAKHFGSVVGGDTIPGVRKPDPRTLFATIEALNATPARAVMVGDNANDVGAARNAGIPVLLVDGGYTATPAADLGADGVVNSFTDLPEALLRLARSA